MDHNIEIKKFDIGAYKAAKAHWLSIAKPLFSLGGFEEMTAKIAGIKGRADFSLGKKALVIMCADNGVVCEGVTQTGQAVTATVTGNFALGETSVCKMAEYAGVDVFPVDIGVVSDVENVTDKSKKLMYGTNDILKGPAMTRETAKKAIRLGIDTVGELAEKGYDIICTGEMGIGNTTTSSAVTFVLLGLPAEVTTGRGAGLTSEALLHKISVVKKAVEVNSPDGSDIIDVLSKVGGLDIAGLVGVFIGGAVHGTPIVIDGFISAAAALCAVRLCEGARDFIIPSHFSKEPAVSALFEELGMKPVIDADMCLGEGTGAVMLMPLLDMALAVYKGMKTFDTWNGNEKYKILE